MATSTETTETTFLFVYGTLRRGAPMHGLLEDGARRVAEARVDGRLYDMGAYPAFVPGGWVRGRGTVCGELYEIPGDPTPVLDALDRYEGEQFERVVLDVETTDGRSVEAFVFRFLGDVSRARPIDSGDYLQHLAGISPGGRGSPPE